MTDQTPVADVTMSREQLALVRRYKAAKGARARWDAEEREAKAALLESLGYDQDDPKPQPAALVDSMGSMHAEVRVGTCRGLDFKYLKETYPDVYAVCETSKETLTIKVL